MAVAAHLPHDHATDWLLELKRLAAAVDLPSASACLAVITTIDAFAAEDGVLAQPAVHARALIAASLAEPDTNTSLLPTAEALFLALKQTLRRAPSHQTPAVARTNHTPRS